MHFCIGLRLGRLELQAALRSFLRWIPEYEVPLAEIHWSHLFATRQMAALPISFAPSPPRAPAGAA